MEGGITSFRPLLSEDEANFNNALKNIMGKQHCPFAVSTQVVSGIKYMFLCNSYVPKPDSVCELSLVSFTWKGGDDYSDPKIDTLI